MPKKAQTEVIEEPRGLVWSDTSISECPGCGATAIVGIMSLSTVCRYCGLYYVDVPKHRGWYSSRQAYAAGAPAIPCAWVKPG